MNNPTNDNLELNNKNYKIIQSAVKNFNSVSNLSIPEGITSTVKKHLKSKKNYLVIDKDRLTAIDKTMIIVSNLTSTVWADNKYKTLNWKILHDQIKTTKNNVYTYKKILNILTELNIIEVYKKNGRETYLAGARSKMYKLNDKYTEVSTVAYRLSNEVLIGSRSKSFFRELSKISGNAIVSNLIMAYSMIEIKNSAELLSISKELIKEGQINPVTGKKEKKTVGKSGKILTLLNGHKKSYFDSYSNDGKLIKGKTPRAFVEHHIKQFKGLTTVNGYMIPVIGSKNAGGRVYDSFTSSPKWIRDTVTMNGNELVEVDVSCFHPNIASTIYGGTGKVFCHNEISNYLGISRLEAKEKHLSFFNKEIYQMEKCELYRYYLDNEPVMLTNIINEKKQYGYKKTSERLFSTEVEVMTELIKAINEKDIYCLYVFDAIYVEKPYIDIVKKEMAKALELFNINAKFK